MSFRLFPPPPLRFSLAFLFWVLIEIPISSSFYDWYSSCSNKFDCGNITSIGFPFWGGNRPEGCGYPSLKLSCNKTITGIDIMGINYHVLGLNENTRTLSIARADFSDDLCRPKFQNTTLDYNLFDMIPGFQNISLIYCISSDGILAGQFSCSSFQFGYIQARAVGPGNCNSSVVIPISLSSISNILDSSGALQAIQRGFDVKWKVDSEVCDECRKSMGVCGYDLSLNETTCYCKGQANGSSSCPLQNSGAPVSSPAAEENKSVKAPVIIGISVGGAAILALLLGCRIVFVRQKKKKQAFQSKSKELPSPPSSNDIFSPSSNLSKSIYSYPYSKFNIEKRESKSNYFGAQVFSYEELEEATDNFHESKELGDGGFGTVYYGKLRDGRVVAVKRLYEHNCKRVEQFKNEVEIITRLQHHNLVKLYGCTSRHSQELLLVYEFVPNGTVADHLTGNRANSGLLTWPVRLRIAIETAEALAYLHRSDIIHRDVKTNNILLDHNFHVKVADFGLSRLFPTNVTHVSTAPQGTPGYVDPEYYQCYQLTDKSDVYSFGVVLIELISSLQAVDTTRHRTDINLANMAVNKIQKHALVELVDPYLGFEKNYAVRRTITMVAELAFQCLLPERDGRPSMSEVFEALRGLENEELTARVVDFGDDDVGLLRNMPSPFSPDAFVTDKWMKLMNRTM